MKIKAFIVTQYPPAEDAVDFLRLLIDHESDTVICMDPLTDIKSVSVFVLLCIILHNIKAIEGTSGWLIVSKIIIEKSNAY